jgi:3-deoxy-7-phosphoheptulonate synthase
MPLNAQTKVSDVNLVDSAVLPAPEYLLREIPRSETQAVAVARARRAIRNIIFGNDPRLLVVIGPCSIHDVEAGQEYAGKLAALAKEVQSRLYLVMRVYFEKPRTSVGWKGLIMDPRLDGSADIPLGLKMARRFLRDVIDAGLPTATELLDPITPQYISDLICWSAIGARTSESQTHRQMASGLSMPLGFKNTTYGDTEPAINAIKAARESQTFLGISHQGLASAITTAGNPDCHLILRGGHAGPNYAAEYVASALEGLQKARFPEAVMIDCSHANCSKDPRRMPVVFREVVEQARHNPGIIGAMLESNLVAGSQNFPRESGDLLYGQSITDPCIAWEETETLLREAFERLEPRFGTV